MVEQQYRHRLHARFEALLDVLPERLLDHHGGEEGEEDGMGDDGLMGVRGGGSGSGSGSGKGVGKGVIVGRVGKGVGGGNNNNNKESRDGKGVKGKNNRRMSKVDVLSTATRVIRFLEGDLERKKRQVEGWKREREMVFARRGHGHGHGHGLGGGWGVGGCCGEVTMGEGVSLAGR